MNNNVIQLFGRKQPVKEAPPVDVTGLVSAIVDWAEEQGVDVHNDVAFKIRVADLMAHLQVLARESRQTA